MNHGDWVWLQHRDDAGKILKNDRLKRLSALLISEGYKRLAAHPEFVKFTDVSEADDLLNDLDRYPHAFVIGSVMNKQMKAEKAWLIPHELKKRLRSFEFAELASLARCSPERFSEAMRHPTPLHRFPNEMSKNLLSAINHINGEYSGHAAEIWAGDPSSATIVRRFLEFPGVGQKIASMAANILVRDLRVKVSDYYSIDISVDVQVMRVFTRMGFVPENASNDYLIFRARECHPEYPGIFDLILWEIGRNVCKQGQPLCGDCRYRHLCAYTFGGNL